MLNDSYTLAQLVGDTAALASLLNAENSREGRWEKGLRAQKPLSLCPNYMFSKLINTLGSATWGLKLFCY